MLTFQEFMEIATKGNWLERGSGPHACSSAVGRELQDHDLFAATWRVGGLTGGNCWGGSADESVDADDEPNLDTLIEVMERSGISFAHGMALMRNIRYSEFSERGYYGNYDNYRVKYITFDEVYDRLVELELAEDRPTAPTP